MNKIRPRHWCQVDLIEYDNVTFGFTFMAVSDDDAMVAALTHYAPDWPDRSSKEE